MTLSKSLNERSLEFNDSSKLETVTLDNCTNLLVKCKRTVKNYTKILHLMLYVSGEEP